jgi:soluble lytic murein transglycosylase-like protein
MKKIILLIILQTTYLYAEEFVATPIPEDAYVISTYLDEQRFLAQYPIEDRDYIKSISVKYRIPVRFLYRQHYIESKLNPSAVRQERNGSVSVGYSQINSVNWDHFQDKFNGGKKINYYDKYQNIEIGAIYMRYLVEHLNGDWLGAYMCYCWGIGNFNSDKRIPKQVIEYSFSIYYGTDYTPCVEILWGAVEEMI